MPGALDAFRAQQEAADAVHERLQEVSALVRQLRVEVDQLTCNEELKQVLQREDVARRGAADRGRSALLARAGGGAILARRRQTLAGRGSLRAGVGGDRRCYVRPRGAVPAGAGIHARPGRVRSTGRAPNRDDVAVERRQFDALMRVGVGIDVKKPKSKE
jgi:hypothetical protein